MDSAEFLDILGNSNRRRILRLLSQKPCYVTEISDFLGVSPKAVIDHLRKLEDAGLVESRTDDRRRKYFSISRHVRLEVTVSPYEFGTKSAYPASSGLDITTCRQLNIEIERPVNSIVDGDSADEQAEDVNPDTVGALARQLNDFENLNKELSLAQRWTQGWITKLRESIADRIDDGDPRLVTELLVTLAEGDADLEELSRTVDAPPPLLEEILEELATSDIVTRDGSYWTLTE